MRALRLKSTLLGAVAGLNIIFAKIRLGSGNYVVEVALIFLLNISIERHHGSKLLETLMNGNKQLLPTPKKYILMSVTKPSPRSSWDKT
jgi:hypothetical protein